MRVRVMQAQVSSRARPRLLRGNRMPAATPSDEHVQMQIRTLLDEQRFGVLATRDGEQPYASLIAISPAEDLRTIFFGTLRATRKLRNLMREPRAALLIDSRQNLAADVAEAEALTVLGQVQEVAGDQAGRVRTLLIAQAPHLERFYQAPSCALLAFTVERYIRVSRFQEVTELVMR
ncbi:MAG: pyridoxamine 5'-phosphate oxidase family protein [Candidatus Eisenbacteria bacterium]|nr:pyridoxamine 5'-phosphate oxidase family protein [Candidatus Eisenbacteria bacterium]